jgi:hypothetical protein
MLSLAALLVVGLPEEVWIPTTTEALGVGQIYAVRDGVLWVKSDTWMRFPGAPAQPIVAVFADERSHLMVVTDDGSLHHHENGAWNSLWGLPSLPVGRARLSLPFPVSSLRPGRIAYSMRRDHALYYEDIRGQQFHWGDVGCTSIYALADDDTRILFADPWIPPDFSREVCGPERGGVRIASLAASASVLFVIAKNGEMFTRFDDYDHNGGTPLFPYSYAQTERQARPGTEPSSAIQIRALPGHDWRAQQPIPLAGEARISRRIAIVQNGVGNDARELRVAGRGADGTPGVWRKQLLQTSWEFVQAEVPLNDDDWIDPSATARVAPRAMTMLGRLPRGFGNVVVRTSDFSFHCSPFTMTWEIDGAPVQVIAHAVDAWTMFAHANPVDDDTAPKLLKLTLALAPDQTLDKKTRTRIDEIFAGTLGKTFAFVGVANQHELVIAPLGYPFTAARSRWQLALRVDPRMQARRVVPLRPASKLAAELGDCDKIVPAVRAQRADIERRLALFSALETGVPMGTATVDVATILTTTRFTLEPTRWLDAMELHLPAVLAAPAIAYARWLDGSREDYERVLRDCRVKGRAPR